MSGLPLIITLSKRYLFCRDFDYIPRKSGNRKGFEKARAHGDDLGKDKIVLCTLRSPLARRRKISSRQQRNACGRTNN